MRRLFQATFKVFLPGTISEISRHIIRSCDLIFAIPPCPRKFINRVKKKWVSISTLFRRILQNLVIGIGICVILVLFQNTAIIKKAEDAGIDWMMKMYRGVKPVNESIAYTLLDIDEETYQVWGEPLITPRDKLLKLIYYASKGRPKIIIIDVDLSRRIGEYDDDLYDFIDRYGKSPEESDNNLFNVSPIILVRTFKNLQIDKLWSFKEQRSSFLDAAVKNNHLCFGALRFLT
jgi:hypothetical protein